MQEPDEERGVNVTELSVKPTQKGVDWDQHSVHTTLELLLRNTIVRKTLAMRILIYLTYQQWQSATTGLMGSQSLRIGCKKLYRLWTAETGDHNL